MSYPHRVIFHLSPKLLRNSALPASVRLRNLCFRITSRSCGAWGCRRFFAAERFSRVVVGCCVAKATTLPLLGYDGTLALSAREAAAARRAVGITLTYSCDELSPSASSEEVN